MSKLNLDERYEKLKQSDRMEFLAFNSIYENRENNYFKILFLSVSFKIFFFVILLAFLISVLSILNGEVITIGESFSDNSFSEISLKNFVIVITFEFFTFSVEIFMFVLILINNYNRKKLLNEFILERNIT